MSCGLQNQKQACSFDPRGSGFLCVCTHECLSNLRWHHTPFITGRGVGPCHLLSSLLSRPQRREEEQGREGGKAGGEPGRRRYSLVKLKQCVRHWRLLSHQIRHMFLSGERLSSQQFCKCYHLAQRQFIKHIQCKKVSVGSLHHQLLNCQFNKSREKFYL